MFKKNPFGHYLILKKWLIRYMGFMTHRRYRGFNQLNIEGSEIIKNLPDKNVLFISNHQTYFADVVAMFHVFNASLSGRIDSIKNVGYLWSPKLNIYYVAAKETMRAGLLPRILAYAGSVSIERTWRENGQDVKRQVKMSDITNIGVALDDGWVITFPQGTTKPFKPVRKGTAHIIKKYKLEKPYFLHTGTFEPRKNHLTLLDAYQLYRENGGRTTSLILTGGTGWKSKKIHQAIKTHPYKDEIKILGFVDPTARESTIGGGTSSGLGSGSKPFASSLL